MHVAYAMAMAFRALDVMAFPILALHWMHAVFATVETQVVRAATAFPFLALL